MTRRVLLPSESDVHSALANLRELNGNEPVAARDLARHLGLANSTFWRHFPEIAQVVANERRSSIHAVQAAPVTSPSAGDTDGALRKENASLRDQIELAVAHIQQLTIDNQVLRNQLEALSNIAKLPMSGAQR